MDVLRVHPDDFAAHELVPNAAFSEAVVDFLNRIIGTLTHLALLTLIGACLTYYVVYKTERQLNYVQGATCVRCQQECLAFRPRVPVFLNEAKNPDLPRKRVVYQAPPLVRPRLACHAVRVRLEVRPYRTLPNVCDLNAEGFR